MNLRNILAIALIASFFYVISDIRQDFMELRIDRITQIETALNE
jgi:hypothetical protein